jgi:hypothetical protein
MNSGSVDNLKVSARCGCKPKARQMRNQVRAAYNKARRLPERRKMMQAWADHLDGLQEGAKLVPLRRAS